MLEVFKEIPEKFLIKDRRIETDGRITMNFNKSLKNPSLRIIEPISLDSLKTVEFSGSRDSATIWLPEITFDSISIAIHSENTALDTLKLRRNKKDNYVQSLIIMDNISNSKIRPGSDLTLKFSSPIKSIQDAQITLLEDSVSTKALQIIRDSSSLRTIRLKYPWKLKKQYNLKIAENAITDIINNKSKVYTRRFELDTEDNYGSISFNVSSPDTTKSYIIQWLNDKKEVIRQNTVVKSTVINYVRYPTAKYYIRVVYDENKNGEWDTGNIKKDLQPEKVWNFGKIISLRPNWDLEESLIIPALE